MTKKIGIDLGSSSLGWFIREDNEIINNGVVTFKTGMVKGQGGYTSPTKDRREARSKRRLIQAQKYRKWELLKILVANEYVPLKQEELEVWSKYKKGQNRKFPETEIFKKWLACNFTYLEDGIKYKNPYELRVNAIDNKLSKHEFGRALYHLVQRRGYKDIGESDKETKTQIARRDELGFDKAMKENKLISKVLKIEFLDKGKRARNEYPYRAEYEYELITICKAQGFDITTNDKKEYNDAFVKQLRKAIIWQQPLRSQKGNIGKCTLEPSKQRCPASHPIFEIFRTWGYLNTIKIVDVGGNKKAIPLEYKKALFNDVFLKKDKNFKFDIIQKYLDKLFEEKKEYNYYNKHTKKYDSTVSGMPVSKGIINLFGDKVINEISKLHTYNIGTKNHNVYKAYSIYDLWHIIYDFEKDYVETFAINKLDIANEIKVTKKGDIKFNPVVKFKNESFNSSFADLSLKAMRKIIPFLQEGFLYNEAVLLAKIPDNYKEWKNNKQLIYDIIENSNIEYNYNKEIISISNNLIDKYKGLTEKELFAYKNYSYTIGKEDIKEIENSCTAFYGNKTWVQKDNKEDIIDEVKTYYQEFFNDSQRRYRELPTLTHIIKKQFKDKGIQIDGELYHHSDKKNIYGTKQYFDYKTGLQVLPIPLIDSIKNPMFNKTMSILRKLINELIINGDIDEDTEIIVEVARELNDNNKRIAIERYQNERKANREKYREFINEFKEQNNQFSNLNVEENIPVFEMWTEQTFEDTKDEKGKEISNKNRIDILNEKKAIKRFELWAEQKGQCMYTGKMISITQLFTSEIEIEHTIPRSLLPDNTMANQTVCYSKYNSDIKNNRIPTACPNYTTDKDFGSAIEPRLGKWKSIRDNYEKQYKDRQKPFGNEDEEKKNRRIQEKHYFRMHFDYWNDKVNRFITEEIKDSWVRRQLVDTQMVSKYAREFLKTYFKKVVVQKGSVTADFRKIFKFQEQDAIKSRNKHTHHSIDAAVLTLIPANSSKRVAMLNKMYKMYENNKKQFTAKPDGFSEFNAQELIDFIDRNTLIVNYQKDKITEQTYRNVRKRGKLQYLTDKNGKYILDDNNEKILLKAQGSSIRGNLFKDTFIGKIKNVERDKNQKPIRNEDKTWQYKIGNDEYTYTVRKPIQEAKIEDIIDPDIKNLIIKQKGEGIDIEKMEDHQGNIIRHVRVKTKAGKKVKNRLNYKSKHDYKNAFYSASGEIPYAIFLTKSKNDIIERKMIPVAIHEVAQVFKEIHKFDVVYYLNKFYPDLEEYQDVKLLKVGQKVFVLKDDNEFEKRTDIDFQMNRMYVITQFKYDGSKIMLKYHLEAQAKSDIDIRTKQLKNEVLSKIEKELGISQLTENLNIENNNDRKKDLEKRVNNFSNRLKIVEKRAGKELAIKSKIKIEEYQTESSNIIIEGQTSILGLSQKKWNFLFEEFDFEIDITGNLKWLI